MNLNEHDKRHGGPFDRGSADVYYGRPRTPHFYVAGTGTSRRIEEKDMSEQEIAQYNFGYDTEEDRKDWLW